MWGLIKYMFKCLAMSVSASFGNNPEGMTWTIAFVGIGTLILLILLALGLIYLGMFILNIFLEYKKKE
jgi:hypothetical protein